MKRELVERARAGDHEAFSELARASIARLYAIANLVLRDVDRAPDAVQDVLVSAWKDMRALRDPDAWDAWLHTIEIRPTGGGAAEVSGNTAQAITFAGLDGTGVTIRDNTVRGGDDFGVGINLGPGPPTIEGNDIGDVRVGIVIPNDATPTIRSNVIAGTDAAIAVNGVSTTAVIEDNQLCGHQEHLNLQAGSSFTLDASNETCPA